MVGDHSCIIANQELETRVSTSPLREWDQHDDIKSRHAVVGERISTVVVVLWLHVPNLAPPSIAVGIADS